jgi:hypothetical protein
MAGNGNRGSAARPSSGRPTHDDARAGATTAPLKIAHARTSQSFSTDWQPHWQDDQDDAAHRARRLLTGPGSYMSGAFLYRLGDFFRRLGGQLRAHRWAGRLVALTLILAAISGSLFGLLWWRLGEGPIGLDIATPWLTAAIRDNVSSDYAVEIGGTQIERAGRARVAVRVLDIVVRDRDKQIVATAPKAEVRVSGTSLLFGRLRAESLSLVDAELSVLIEQDGRVSVSTGATTRPRGAARCSIVTDSAGGSSRHRRPGAGRHRA